MAPRDLNIWKPIFLSDIAKLTPSGNLYAVALCIEEGQGPDNEEVNASESDSNETPESTLSINPLTTLLSGQWSGARNLVRLTLDAEYIDWFKCAMDDEEAEYKPADISLVNLEELRLAQYDGPRDDPYLIKRSDFDSTKFVVSYVCSSRQPTFYN